MTLPFSVPLLALALTAPAPLDVLPVAPARVVAPFHAPGDEFSAGHRGTDLAATPGAVVRAPLSGVVTFSGMVAGRAVLVLSDGRRTATLEPVAALVPVGQAVLAGQLVGRVATGGHCSARCLHLGLRVDGTYVDPLRSRAHLVP